MPQTQRKRLQNGVVDAVLYITLFAVLGHVSVNFWERMILQNELSKMKTNLYLLKDTIFSIGTAYDNLQKDIEVLAQMAETSVDRFKKEKNLDKDQAELGTMTKYIEIFDAPVAINTTNVLFRRKRGGHKAQVTFDEFVKTIDNDNNDISDLVHFTNLDYSTQSIPEMSSKSNKEAATSEIVTSDTGTFTQGHSRSAGCSKPKKSYYYRETKRGNKRWQFRHNYYKRKSQKNVKSTRDLSLT